VFYRVKRTMKLGAKSLWMHRLRSVLTTLGIIFGVCSVIAMLAIGEGASREAQAQIARLGSRNLIIETVKPPAPPTPSTEGATMLEYGLTYDDAERIKLTMPSAEVVVPLRRTTQDAWYRNQKAMVEVIGTVPWYPETAPVRVRRGRFLNSLDLQHRQAVCVVDLGAYERLMVFDDPLRASVKIGGDYYKVVGVVAGGPVSADDQNGSQQRPPQGGGVAGQVYLPLTTVKERFGEVNLQFGNGGAQGEKVELQQITVKVARDGQVLPSRDMLQSLLNRFHKQQDYRIVVPLELLRQAARTKRIFSVVLGSIAAISLVVGGIGIMNIMLATVSERTREIGIRRALGARQRDIVVQFLSETVTLTMAGGLLGIVLGSIIPFLVTRFAEMPTVITGTSLVLAFGISGAVGLTFGLYPAYRAAQMDPIESLRHE